MCNVADCKSAKLYNGSQFCYRHRGQIKVAEAKPVAEDIASSDASTADSSEDEEVVAEVETPVVAKPVVKFVEPAVFKSACVVAVTERLLKQQGVSKEAKDYVVSDHVDLVLACPWDTIRCYRFEFDGSSPRYAWVSAKYPDLVAQFLDTCSKQKMNYHEVFLSGRRGYRFFLDLDIKLPYDSESRVLFDDSPFDTPIESQKAAKFMEYLEQYITGAYESLSTYLDASLCTDIKLSYDTRNRETDDNGVKYSIHAFTNLILPSMASCKIVASKMIELAKETIQYKDEYDEEAVEFAKVMIASLDTSPYHTNGSLAMTGSYKGIHCLKRVSEVEHIDHSVCYYQLKHNGQHEMTLKYLETKKEIPAQDFSGCDDFLKAVCEKATGLAWSSAYNVYPEVNNRGFMKVSRKDCQSYDCCICDRVHASTGANWLKIMVFKDTKTAIYGCRRSNEKMRVFYKATQSVASVASNTSEEYVVDEDALIKKLDEAAKPKVQQAIICEEILKLLVQLPADLIRAKDGLTIDDIIIGLDAFSIQETAKTLKSTMAYVSNSGNDYYLAKSFQTVYFKDAPVEMIAYNNMGGKHGNSYDTMHFTIRIKDQSFKMNLKDVLTACKKGIGYTTSDVRPYSPLETIDTGRTFNLFGQYQHKYDPEFVVDMDIINPFRNHIKDVLAAGDDANGDYIENWLASLLQKPGHKTQSVLLIKGLPGCGKNVLFNIYMRFVLNPSLALCCADMDKLFGRFNSLRLGKLLIVVDEALDSNDRRMNNKMKNVITEERQHIEKKGKDTIEVSDFSNYVILTNNDFASIIEKNDRRYVCLEASDCRRGDKQYFKMLVDKLMNPEAGKHIFHYLLRKDLSEFDTRDIPSTSYKRELSLRQDNVAKWLLSLREMWIDRDDDSAHSSDSKDWYRMYTEWCESSNERTTHSLNVFNSLMNSHGFITNVAKQKQPDGTRKSVKVRSISVGTIERNLKDFIV
jgi:hypothetical protein